MRSFSPFFRESSSLLFLISLVVSQSLWLHVLSSAEVDDDANPVQMLIDAALENTRVYERLAYLGDTFGPRFSGTAALEDAIQWAEILMHEEEGVINIAREPVKVPHWVRGDESLRMVTPREASLAMLGLGGSIGTDGPLTAEVLVVSSFDELAERAAEAKGRIVVYNVPFTTYSATSRYRRQGAVEAARVGAVASLTRSITDHSLYTPHTGSMSYEAGVPQIPAAAITVEDAAMFGRMAERGTTITLTLTMNAKTLEDALSHNLIGELPGTDLSDEIVVVGGHFDSWDVGTGMTDDAGGCLMALETLHLMNSLGVRPRRTVRAVFFTNEENGARGAAAYLSQHAHEVNRTVFALESDQGLSLPYGYSFQGNPAALPTLQALADHTRPTLDLLVREGGAGVDIGPLCEAGVPGVGLLNDEFDGSGTDYFDVHHTMADTFDKIRLEDLRRSLAAVVSMVFQVANMEGTLPRIHDTDSV